MRRNRCLICHTPLVETLSFATLFQKEETNICRKCKYALIKIREHKCKRCSKPCKDDVCSDCLLFERQMKRKRTHNTSLYVYNDKMKEIIANWKFRGDAVLVDVFREELQTLYRKKWKGFTVVPIPLHEKRLAERGFNQAMQLARLMTEEVTPLLIRTDETEGRSKWTKKERMKQTAQFEVRDTIKLKSPIKQVLLIDDIYTTGTTIENAYEALKHIQTIETIQAITLARG